VPLKDRSGEVLGMWFVGMPKAILAARTARYLS